MNADETKVMDDGLGDIAMAISELAKRPAKPLEVTVKSEPVNVEVKVPEPKPCSWKIRITERDAKGMPVEYILSPI